MVCLDTSFIIDLLRGNPNIKSFLNIIEKSSKRITIASPSIMELITGANLSEKISQENKKIIDLLSTIATLNLDKESAIKAGQLEAQLIKNGERIDSEDIMIAAIAIKNNETLITGNKKHFERINELKLQTY